MSVAERPPALSVTEMSIPGRGELTVLDRKFLSAALRLGQSRIGKTSPNPSVGAILVQLSEHGPIVVGRGVTGDGGRPHGEVAALRQAGDAAVGATCYVSLEPCAHHGKTPPCVNALIEAGVARVVVAVNDPDPRVSGKGLNILSAQSIDVIDGNAAKEGKLANLGHFKRIATGRPAITLKLAVSQDGMIGKKGDGQVAITGPLARRHAHGLRARADAIMVGSGTVLEDNPALTCRLPGMSDWSPLRVLLDSHTTADHESKFFKSAATVGAVVFSETPADTVHMRRVEAVNAEVVPVSSSKDGLDLEAVLKSLGDRGITNLLVEGGARLATSLLEKNLVDRAIIYRSEVIVGQDGVAALTKGRILEDALSQNGLILFDRYSLGEDSIEIWGED